MLTKRYYDPKLETMARAEFLDWQWRQLQKQVSYVYARSGLCRRQFEKARITPDDIKTRDDFINRVPFTTKQDLLADQQENPPYGTRLAVPEDEIFFTYLTSGTSGRGQEVHTMSKADFDFYTTYDIAMIYRWYGWQRGDKVMNPLPFGITVAAPLRYIGLQRLGCDVFNLGMFDTRTKLEYMKRFKISGINASPAYLTALTTEAAEMGLDPARDLFVRKILMAGQAYPLSFVPRMEEIWQAKIYDYYGATQYVTGSTCEEGALVAGERGYYHLFQHVAFHEVINPETGHPVGPGEVGEMVVTPLNKQASPFLRFRMGDRVRYFPHGGCDCGRPFDLLEAGTIARYDDMIKIKGMNIWPETIDELILGKEGAAEYKGRVYISEEGKEKVEVAIEFKRGVAGELKQRLMAGIAEEIRDKTGIGFIVAEASEELPRYVTKASSLRWIDERIKGLEKKSMG